MNKLKKLYRDFFGLTEQAVTNTSKVGAVKMPKATTKPDEIKKLTDKGLNVQLENSDMVDEAQLINNIIDYRGGVEYVLRNPAEAESVATEIREWATKKGFTVVKHTRSASGKVGYFYFRLGENPYKESKKIQGYISQLPIVKHFRFNVRNEQPVKQPNM